MAKKTHNREKGTGTIEKKGNHFYLKFMINGILKRELLFGPDDKPVTIRKDAEKAADLLKPVLRATQKEEIALHVASARKLRKEITLPVEKVWDTFLKQSSRPDSGEVTLEGYHKLWKLFLKWLQETHPEIINASQITHATAMEYFNWIWQNNLSPRSYNSRRHALSLIFKHIYEVAGMTENPFDKISLKPLTTGDREALTEEQVQQIFAAFETGFFYETMVERMVEGRKHEKVLRRLQFNPMYKDEMYVMLNLCCWTGCRGEDGCLMQWSNIDWKHNSITYIPMKTARKTGYKSVTLPLHPQLYEALKKAESWRNSNKSEENYIVPNVAHRYKYNSCGVQKDVMKIIRCATGLETSIDTKSQHRKIKANKYSLHSFRHTFVSFCANAGVPMAVVASIVGHTSTAMTQHYTHISDEAKNKAIQALPVLSEKPVADVQKDKLLEQLSEMSAEELQHLLNQKNTLEFTVPPATESSAELAQGSMDFNF